MASSCYNYLVFSILLMSLASTAFSAAASLTPYYYSKVCPAALPTIKRVVEAAVENEGRMGASLLRLHFHDCFVNGCDASVLLDPTSSIDSEKNAFPNIQSLRGFEVVDKIKSEVDKACGYKSVVSCADILAVAARDSVVALGGPWWEVLLGRRDSTTASRAAANTDIPAPFLDLPQLIASFAKQGLDVKDLVALSGGHTLGYAQCRTFRTRIYNETNIDPYFAKTLKKICPKKSPNGDLNIAGLDSTPVRFDTNYFGNLVRKKGLLHSDQALFGGVSTDGIVKSYSYDLKAFGAGFAYSMVKMGNIKPLTGYKGQVRVNCRVVNKY